MIKNAILFVYDAFFGGILFNQHLHYRGEYRGKIPDGHSNPIYSVLKLLKLQNV